MQNPIADLGSANLQRQSDLRVAQPEGLPFFWGPMAVIAERAEECTQEGALPRVVLTDDKVDAFGEFNLACVAEGLETLYACTYQPHHTFRTGSERWNLPGQAIKAGTSNAKPQRWQVPILKTLRVEAWGELPRRFWPSQGRCQRRFWAELLYSAQP